MFCLFSIKDMFKGPEFSQKITLSILNINVTHVSLPKMSALLLFATSFRKRKRALRVWKKALCDVIKQSTPLPGHSSSFFVVQSTTKHQFEQIKDEKNFHGRL